VATRFFKTEREGKTVVKYLETQREKYGAAGMMLPDEHRVDAARAVEILAPFPAHTLVDAARFYTAHLRRLEVTCTVKEMRDRFIQALRADHKDDEHIRTAKSKLSRFTLAFEHERLTTFTAAKLDDWLRSLKLAPTTRNGIRTYLRSAFEFARKAGLVEKNPVTDTATATVGGKPVSILTPDQMKKLLAVASPTMRLYFAIGGFAGLRPSEIERLRVRDVRDKISVDTEDPRSYSRRFVDISANLNFFLGHDSNSPDLLVPLSSALIKKERREAAAAAGISPWPADVLRHSFASYHYALHQDLGTLVAQMGHSDAKMLQSHYRERVTKEEAVAWFGITLENLEQPQTLTTP
jgi:integrase